MRAFVATATAVAAVTAIDPATPSELVEARWEEFKKHFGRTYATSEEERLRKEYFAKNMNRAEELNAKDDNWIPSGHLSPLADWSQSEFDQRNSLQAQLCSANPVYATAEPAQTLRDTDSWDWREKDAVNAVKNQGQCGSCWSFATVANIEGVYAAHKNQLLSLSEQQLVDCDKSDHGCNGGLPELADKWLIAHDAGLETEARYPYKGVPQHCQQDVKRERVFVGKFLHISNDEDMIAQALMQHGPLAIGINANTMQMYMGGIANPDVAHCDPQMLNHGVALVGFGSEDTPLHPQAVKTMIQMHRDMKTKNLIENMPEVKEKGTSTKFWIIRNSWGEMWGEQGYYRIVRGKGACGLNTMVTTAEGVTYKPPSDGEPDLKKAATEATAEKEMFQQAQQETYERMESYL